MKTDPIQLNQLYKLKKSLLYKPTKPIFSYFKKHHVNPDHITLIGYFFSLMAVFSLFLNQSLTTIAILAHILMDNLDGFYARTINQQTKKGQHLDHWGDFTYGALLMLRVYFHFKQAWMIIPISLYIINHLTLNFYSANDERASINVFEILAIFGKYHLGMIFQFIIQPFFFLHQIIQIKNLPKDH